MTSARVGPRCARPAGGRLGSVVVASLAAAAEGGFRLTGYKDVGCESTSMSWGDSLIRRVAPRPPGHPSSPP